MRTTIGQLLIEQTLPKQVKLNGPLDKAGMGKLLTTIATDHMDQYGHVVKNLRDIGNQIAYETGTSFTLDDLKPHTELRDEAFSPHTADLDAIRRAVVANPNLVNNVALQKKKLETLAKVEDRMNASMKKVVHGSHTTNLTAWVKSGARGDPAMARQMIGMAGMNLDAANKVMPEISKRSFSEGLSPIDFFVHANGARRGIVNTYTAVRDPGAFAKELNTITMDMVVTAADCGTSKGRMLPTSNPDILDRCLAENVAGIGHHNDVITTRMRERLIKKQPQVMVRSPLYCQAAHGVCSRCVGLNEEGRLPPVGEHIGLKSAQALTEPLTQLALNTKHTGGVIGAGKSPLHNILQLMHAPKVFVGAATLAKQSGKVEHVEAAAAGGWNVHVGGLVHYVQPEHSVAVKPGQLLGRGDRISTGTMNPVEVVEHKGMEQGRLYFADALKDHYAESGIRGHGRVFETVARGILNLGQVIHPGTHSFMPGEVVHWNAVQQHLPTSHDTMPVAKAAGRILAAEAGHLGAYANLTPKMTEQLAAKGIQQVTVFKPNSLIVKPVMLGTERAALHKGDWMANLAFRFVNQTFKENVATAATTEIRDSWNPVPTFVYGEHFGKGTGGKF